MSIVPSARTLIWPFPRGLLLIAINFFQRLFFFLFFFFFCNAYYMIVAFIPGSAKGMSLEFNFSVLVILKKNLKNPNYIIHKQLKLFLQKYMMLVINIKYNKTLTSFTVTRCTIITDRTNSPLDEILNTIFQLHIPATGQNLYYKKMENRQPRHY